MSEKPRKKIILPSTDLIVQIANEFSKIIQELLTEEQLEQVNNENRELGYDSFICQTGDHCDSNMAMDEAFKKCGIEEEFASEDEILVSHHASIWNCSWQTAKENEFKGTVKSSDVRRQSYDVE